MEGKAPATPSETIDSLLKRFPTGEEFWRSLGASYEVQLRIAIHTSGWNRGFQISPAVAAMVAATGASVEFDLYFYGEGHDA